MNVIGLYGYVHTFFAVDLQFLEVKILLSSLEEHANTGLTNATAT